MSKNETEKLTGNSNAYNFSQITPMQSSPLKGKRLYILGSSVAHGSASMEDSIGEYFSARMGCILTKETLSGTTLVETEENSYVQRLKKNLNTHDYCDLFIVQLSTNDAAKEKPLGMISGFRNKENFDTATVTGALEFIIAYAKETWQCPVVIFTGSHYASSAYDAMVQQALLLAEKWDIGVLNLWSDPKFNSISDERRALYMYDDIHPTKAGYRDWCDRNSKNNFVLICKAIHYKQIVCKSSS